MVTIGTFDGVHRGHESVLQETLRLARAHQAEAVVVTFEPHPRCVLDPEHCPPHLTSVDEKLLLLGRAGIDRTIVVDFTRAVARLSPDQFMRRLSAGLTIRHMVVGYDFAFGRDRRGDRRFLVRYGAAAGFRVTAVAPRRLRGRIVSSSEIRRLVLLGKVATARMQLGYEYFIQSFVEQGSRVGSRIGYPTANLTITPNKLVPLQGVYAVRVTMGVWGHGADFGERVVPPAQQTYPGALNVGFRPTFGGDKLTVEVFIIGFHGDLYHQVLQVAFAARLRDERKFASAEALMQQIARDVERARRVVVKRR